MVIAHFDWLPLWGSVVEATEALIVAHNPKWKLGGGNGFTDNGSPIYPTLDFVGWSRSVSMWRSRIAMRRGGAASVPAQASRRHSTRRQSRASTLNMRQC
jgi:hypothetical protein